MKFDLETCNIVVWGYKNTFHTHGFVHQAMTKAFRHMGRNVIWLDASENISGRDFSNTLWVTNWDCIDNSYWPWKSTPIRSTVPIREDCFYVVHGLNDHESVRESIPEDNRLSWNVFHDMSNTFSNKYGVPLTTRVFLAKDTPLYPKQRHMDFRWATDLLPHEIQMNKPNKILGRDSDIINWVGTIWRVNEKELDQFRKACESDGKRFIHHGAGQKGVVTPDDNVRLVRESFVAPAIIGSHQIGEGYLPCRLPKNISYGQPGITNSPRMQDLFEGRLIYNPDPHKLYFEAKRKLEDMNVGILHEQMDFVACHHTYLNRLSSVLKAVKFLTEDG